MSAPQASELDIKDLSGYFEKIREANAQHHVLGLQHSESASGADICMYTANQVLDLADAAQSFYESHGIKGSSTTLQGSSSMIAAISAFGNVNWAASFIALARLGFSVLALSPGLSSGATESLLRKAGAQLLVHGSQIEAPTIEGLISLPIIRSKELEEVTAMSKDSILVCHSSVPEISFIWHSSGSTGLPKMFPISQTTAVNRIRSARNVIAPEKSMFITSALYNSAGLTFFLSALTRPAPTYFWDDSKPYTADRLANFLEAAKPDSTTFAPSVLAQLAESDKGLHILKTNGAVSTFGAVCPKALGDSLTAKGIRLSISYAMSETSTLMSTVLRPADDDDWDFLTPLPSTKSFIYMQRCIKGTSADGQGEVELYECVILKGYPNTPASMSKSDNPPGSFHTGDVFEKHPTKPERWRIIGRKDDQINMGLPIVISAFEYEGSIRTALTADVEEVVVFGNGRLRLGVLIFVATAQMQVAGSIREAVWRAVQQSINGRMKVGIDKDMILLVDGKVPRTDKGNFARPLIYREYDELIERAYAGSLRNGERL